MASMPANGDTIFLGIDGGGSKCRARLISSDQKLLGTGLAGPANPSRGVEQAIESIIDSTRQAMADAGLEAGEMGRLVAGAGLAGVNLPGPFDAISGWRHPFKELYLTTDLHTACLGAHRGEEGAVIVVGTGSSGFSCVQGQRFTLGAHGFPVGDQGSGAWIGLEAVKAVLLAFDGLGPATALTGLIFEKFKCDALSLAESLMGATPGEYAKVAPLVFDAAERRDTVADGIIHEGAAYISSLARKLLQTNPPRLSLIGGISLRITPWLDADIAARVSPPLEQPEAGAVYFAQAMYLKQAAAEAG